MEKPTPMVSTVVETDKELIIITPRKKSWMVIIVLAIAILQFSLGLILTLFSDEIESAIVKTVFLLIYSTIVYFAIKGFAWQISGETKMTFNNVGLTVMNTSFVSTKIKAYKLSEVKSVGVRNEAVSQGPLAMLQLLGISDRIKIVFGYGYKIIPIVGGIDMIEAVELKDKINGKLEIIRTM